ncbi:hypothetical protein SNEBB_000412, partial [Seison nebaliae]
LREWHRDSSIFDTPSFFEKEENKPLDFGKVVKENDNFLHMFSIDKKTMVSKKEMLFVKILKF